MTAKTSDLWSAYLLHITNGATQVEIAKAVGTTQVTISRWLNTGLVPTSAPIAAKVARAYGRNPLEAFVAAGMLNEDEAGRGLDDESRDLLAGLRSLRHG